MALLFSTTSEDLLAVLATLLIACVVQYHRNFSHFKKLGVPHDAPLPFIGNVLPVLLKKVSFTTLLSSMYRKYRDRGYFGLFNFRGSMLMVCDPDLIKQVLTKDFTAFHDRGMPYDVEGDPTSANLFNLGGKQWRNLRNKLTPTFTSGKIKNMYPLMVDVGNELSAVMRNMMKKDNNLELNDLISKYSTDLIGTCAFGITCNCLREGNQVFHEMSRQAVRPNLAGLVRMILFTIHPKLARLLPFKLIYPTMTNFFLDLMKDTVEFRDKNKVERNDFVQLMMQIRDSDKRGMLDRDNYIEFTNGVMTAQAFIFFVAGMDSVSNTVSFALHELALNPDLQERAAQEVRDTILKHNGVMTYEAVQQMDLLERIVYESLRKWTPVGLLIRKCLTSTSLGSSGLVVPKDQWIFIPVADIHLDPSLYPNPERFDPDRFTEEAKKQRHQYAYLPFGEGPRVCIAERFAILEMKLCLARLLDDYVFSVGPRTEVTPELDKGGLGPMAKNGIWLKVDEREKPVQ